MRLTSEETELVRSAEFLARNSGFINPALMEYERSFNVAAIRTAAQLGLVGVRVPSKYGGLSRSFSCLAAVTEAIARIDFGFSLALANTMGIATRLTEVASSDTLKVLMPGLLSGEQIGAAALTEPGAGSDFSALTTYARRADNGWIINGRKAWITNGAAANVILVYAQTEPGSGPRGVAGFIVDAARAGFIREPAFELVELNTAGIGGFMLDDYPALDNEMLEPPGKAFKSALALVNNARTYVAAMCCGMVAEALDLAYEYGGRRSTFGKMLHQHQGWRWPLAEASTDLTAARALVQIACDRIDAGEDVQLEAAQAKLFATRMAEQHLPRLAQALGAEALRDIYPFSRHQIAARSANLVDGSSEMLRERVFAGLKKEVSRKQ